MNTWVTMLLPMAGVIIGAILQFWLGRAAEHDKHINSLRAQAYSDYLRGVAMAAHLTSDEDLVTALRSVADAKARMVVYGTVEVISALARFEETGAVLTRPSSVAAFMALVGAMRDQRNAVSEQELKRVLLGSMD